MDLFCCCLKFKINQLCQVQSDKMCLKDERDREILVVSGWWSRGSCKGKTDGWGTTKRAKTLFGKKIAEMILEKTGSEHTKKEWQSMNAESIDGKWARDRCGLNSEKSPSQIHHVQLFQNFSPPPMQLCTFRILNIRILHHKTQISTLMDEKSYSPAQKHCHLLTK